ncbi:MAG: hypothetical protein AB1546_03945 [bacterium]
MIKKSAFFVPLLFIALAHFSYADFPEITPEMTKLQELHRDISLLNLINGLYLTDEQTESLLDTLYDVKTLREKYLKRLADLMPELEEAYTALKDDLIDDDLIEEETEQNAAEIHHEEIQLRDAYMKELSRFEKEAKNILTEKQLQLLEDFKPCLLPPKGPNRSRIGQIGNTSPHENVLNMLRKAPEHRFGDAAARAVEEYIGRYERFNKELTYSEKHDMRLRLMEMAYRIRFLSEPEFESQKATIIEELEAPFKKELEHQEPKKPHKKDEPGKLADFLLDTRLIPLLEKKLEYSELASE